MPSVVKCARCNQWYRASEVDPRLCFRCDGSQPVFPEVKSVPEKHSEQTRSEWSTSQVVVVGVCALLFAAFMIYMTSEIGSLWGDGQSRGFWGNLLVGVVFFVVLGILTYYWSKRQKRA